MIIFIHEANIAKKCFTPKAPENGACTRDDGGRTLRVVHVQCIRLFVRVCSCVRVWRGCGSPLVCMSACLCGCKVKIWIRSGFSGTQQKYKSFQTVFILRFSTKNHLPVGELRLYSISLQVNLHLKGIIKTCLFSSSHDCMVIISLL